MEKKGENGKQEKRKKTKLLVRNRPDAPELCPELAVEIGLAQSILLLQCEFWIANPKLGKVVDGRKWLYKSMRDIQKTFPFWALGTIHNLLHSLVDKNLLLSRNDLNQKNGDATAWYAINEEGVKKLKSVHWVNVEVEDDESDGDSEDELTVQKTNEVSSKNERVAQKTNDITIDYSETTTETINQSANDGFLDAEVSVEKNCNKDRVGSVENLVSFYNWRKPYDCPEVLSISAKRRENYGNYLKRYPTIKFWDQVCSNLIFSHFLQGRKNRNGQKAFIASLDWLCKKDKDGMDNCVKVAEGKYRDVSDDTDMVSLENYHNQYRHDPTNPLSIDPV